MFIQGILIYDMSLKSILGSDMFRFFQELRRDFDGFGDTLCSTSGDASVKSGRLVAMNV